MPQEEVVHLLACQRNSYAKEFEATVISSTQATLKVSTTGANSGGKHTKVNGFEVVFNDTVLFPEGGGQNDDHGSVNGSKVLRVTRKEGKAVHFVQAKDPLKPGDKVVQIVDWTRRFDHMQQHSGQHLISALFENLEKIPTASWWMAETGASFVELQSENITKNQLDRIEEDCNEAIRKHIEVQVKVYDDPESKELEKAKTRGLPADHQGPVRVIEIGDIDSNMCCGTHVSNLAELQMVKLLHSEKSKRKGNSLVYFLVGTRICEYFSKCYANERTLTAILNGGPNDHAALSEKAIKNAKRYQKQSQTLQKELATAKALEIKNSKPKYFSTHRPEVETDFSNVLINELAEEDITVLITMGSGEHDGQHCQLVLKGQEDIVSDLGPKILKLLDAKGGGKGGRLNAKFTSLKKRPEVDGLLQDYFS